MQLMPLKPGVSEVDQADRRAKNQPRLSHQTAIDMLQKDEVLVVDAAGVQFGGVIGDNLAYYIMKTTGADMAGYYRAAAPPAIHDLMVTGINIPIRIGSATVMPGDVVFGDPEGVYFIPGYLWSPARPGFGSGI
jgi:4-hydroxy-4-methyl-2-oxoglutarate aldolase